MTGQYIATLILDTVILAALLGIATYSRNWLAWTTFTICLTIATWGLT